MVFYGKAAGRPGPGRGIHQGFRRRAGGCKVCRGGNEFPLRARATASPGCMSHAMCIKQVFLGNCPKANSQFLFFRAGAG